MNKPKTKAIDKKPLNSDEIIIFDDINFYVQLIKGFIIV